MMSTRLLGATVLALAACGGGSTATPPSTPPTGPGTAPATATAAQLWAAVMQPGASFRFDDREIEQEDPTTVVATVTEVKDVPGGRAIMLAWTERDEPMSTSNMPTVIVIGDAGVTFYTDATAMAADDPEAARYPATAAPAKLPRGLYIDAGTSGLEGELCYGWGPEDDAEECEDTCFSQLCVHPTHGLTGGEGRWWPDWYVYQRTDLRN